MPSKVQNLIVGCGFTGSVLAERLANVKKEKVLVIDKRDHIGGNCFDYIDKNGIHIHKYGPHIFHTSEKKVVDYLKNFTLWHYYEHKPKAKIFDKEVPLPFNFNSMKILFGDKETEKYKILLTKEYGFGKRVPILTLLKSSNEEVRSLAQYIFDNIFLNYSTKQWGENPFNLEEFVTARVPVSLDFDNRYFTDSFQGIPKEGYTKLFKNILDNPFIQVELNTDFSSIKGKISFDRLFFTGSIDDYFDYVYGHLPYRSLKFEFEEYDTEFFQSTSVINYPSLDIPFTRITEFKHFLNDKSSKTVIAKEYPLSFEVGMERYYPIPKQENYNLYQKYNEVAKQEKNVFFVGRLGSYQYLDMDKAILKALDLFEKIK